jgi:branched-chain amino acid transport system substrate-binding protein
MAYVRQFTAMAAIVLLAAACSSSSTNGAGTTSHGGTVKVAVIGPMTGPAAEIGGLMTSACYAAQHQIATTAATTVPIVNNAHIPMFSTDGLVSLDKNSYQYFWRMTPADDQNGAAFGLWAIRQGWKRAAIVFQDNIGAQGNEPGVIAAYHKLGGSIALNVTIPGDAASYSSIAQRVISSHPQVIIAAADPQTSATFFSEYKQLNGGNVPPVVTATDSLTPDYFSAMQKVLGASFVTRNIALVGSYLSTTSAAYSGYKTAMYASSQVKSPATVLGVGVISSIYDGVIIMSLAIQEAGSSSGPAFNADIANITSAGTGKQVVHTYAQGLAAIKAGQKIQYVGVGGPISFNQYHNSPGSFSASGFNSDGSPRVLGYMNGPDVLALLG